MIYRNGYECFNTSAKFSDAMKLYPNSTDSSQAAFTIAYNTEDSLFKWLVKPEHQASLKRFSKGMIGLSKYSFEALSKIYPWKQLGKSTLIDIGGGMAKFFFQKLP
jgi:6-hydroxytryprostatin B O-methyltransferase